MALNFIFRATLLFMICLSSHFRSVKIYVYMCAIYSIGGWETKNLTAWECLGEGKGYKGGVEGRVYVAIQSR